MYFAIWEIFPEVVLLDFRGFFYVALFELHISSIVCFVVGVVKLVVLPVASVADTDNSPTPTLSSVLWPLLPPLVLGNSLPNSWAADGGWFSFMNPFATLAKSINDLTFPLGHSHYSWF